MSFKAKHYGKGDMSKNMVSFGLHGWGTIIYCIMSFFANRWSGYMALLGTLLDPFLRPFRRLLPPIKGFDLSPILFFLLLNLALRFLVPASMGLYVF